MALDLFCKSLVKDIFLKYLSTDTDTDTYFEKYLINTNLNAQAKKST